MLEPLPRIIDEFSKYLHHRSEPRGNYNVRNYLFINSELINILIRVYIEDRTLLRPCDNSFLSSLYLNCVHRPVF
jgi:hypothetical protein